MSPHDERLATWMDALEKRHLAELTFSEVSRALRALSSAYVERRGTIGRGGALSGAGKRAAFALFYGPLHYLLTREIVDRLPGAKGGPPTLVDLGCGTGAAGAAWAAARETPPHIVGIDRHAWAVGEAAWTYRHFRLSARTQQTDVTGAPLPKPPVLMLAAFALNELPDAARDRLLARLLDRLPRGDHLLVVEPIARSVAPWWDKASAMVTDAGGRADEWRFRVELPPLVAKLDRASGPITAS